MNSCSAILGTGRNRSRASQSCAWAGLAPRARSIIGRSHESHESDESGESDASAGQADNEWGRRRGRRGRRGRSEGRRGSVMCGLLALQNAKRAERRHAGKEHVPARRVLRSFPLQNFQQNNDGNGAWAAATCGFTYADLPELSIPHGVGEPVEPESPEVRRGHVPALGWLQVERSSRLGAVPCPQLRGAELWWPVKAPGTCLRSGGSELSGGPESEVAARGPSPCPVSRRSCA